MDLKYKGFEIYLDEMAQAYKIQGLIVGVFDKETLLYEKTLGYSDTDSQKSIDKDTIFGVASITKSFTAMGLLQLAQKKVISLNNLISDYFSDWNLSKKHTPTLSQLMSHTGGFYPQKRILITDIARKFDIPVKAFCTNPVLSKEGIKLILENLSNQKQFTGYPGQRMSYSNAGFGLLTDVLNKMSPYKNYCKAIEEEIISPLHLNRTFFDFQRAQREKNITTLYEEKDNEIIKSKDYTKLGFVLPGVGALKSTFRDLMTYTRMYMNDGNWKNKEILGSFWINEMTKKRIAYKEDQHYGYGLAIGKIDKWEYAGHSGGLPGVSSYFGFSKSMGIGVVVLCNTSGVPASSIGANALRSTLEKPILSGKIKGLSLGTWSRDTRDKTLGVYISEEGEKIMLLEKKNGVIFEIDGNHFAVQVVGENTFLIEEKKEARVCHIFRDEKGVSWAMSYGSRMIPKKKA